MTLRMMKNVAVYGLLGICVAEVLNAWIFPLSSTTFFRVFDAVTRIAAGLALGFAITLSYRIRRDARKLNIVPPKDSPIFLESIFIEAAALKDGDLLPGRIPVCPGDEVVVTEVPLIMQQLWTLADQHDNRAMVAELQCRLERDENAVVSLHRSHIESALRGRFVRQLFWTMVNDTYDLWDTPGLGLRKNWRVVATQPRAPQEIRILGQMGGDE